MRYRLIIVMILVLLVPGAAQADSPAPLQDFTELSADGRFIFVMLVREDDHSAYNQRGFVKEDPVLRRKYRQSGLYHNNGTTRPLWTVDWNAYRVDIASDGHHLIRYGPWPWKGEYDEMALAFYRDGQEIKRYSVRDLVALPERLPASVSHYTWSKSSTFDDATGQLALTTHNNERYVFNLSGAIIEGTPGLSRRRLIAGALILIMGTLLIIARAMTRRRVSHP